MSDSAVSIALIECQGIASGLRMLDLMLKRSPVKIFEANLVEPGKYVVLLGGGVAEVEEALAALIDHRDFILSELHIPKVHLSIWDGLRGIQPKVSEFDTIGIVETSLIAGAISACDKALKESFVSLLELRCGVGLGGRGYFVLEGAQHDIEAAIESSHEAAKGHGGILHAEIIPRPHQDLNPWVHRQPPFKLI